ncbi:hypothetical protein MB27_10710 [Actinoplanes utahensis]|uniref:Nudix hydrolase domain-containing protein n=1 Tax=Actinoplanes utahensis TaxID=1869 RepID=A0A0A6XBX6_ACTUT|nr:hypothetical protein MB27_10710 [Actinoplanes utahensis]
MLEVVSRRDAVRNGWLHRIATTICRDDDGRVLVHRRPDDAGRFPGHYETSFGGAVRAGETYTAAARRELAEETGLDLPVRHLVTFLCHGRTGSYHLAVYGARVPGTDLGRLRPDPEAVAWHGWLTEPELREARERWLFVPDGRVAYDRAAGHW